MLPTLIVRVQDFVWKLSLLYAAVDLSDVIKADHIKPAIAVGNYLESSVAEVFRTFAVTKGKKLEMRALDYLRSAGQPVDYRLAYRDLHLSAKELDAIIEPLIKLGLINNNIRKNKAGKEVRMLQVF